MNDPFASSPWDEPAPAKPFAEDTVIKPGTPLPGETASEGTMSMSTNEVSVTLKGDGGYDQPWIVVKAPTVSALESELKSLKDSGINGLVKELTDAYASVVGRGSEKWEPRSNTPASRGHAAAPAAPAAHPVAAAPAAAPNPAARTCVHGAMVRRTGTNANTGKQWAGHFCPQPKGAPDQCKPVWG